MPRFPRTTERTDAERYADALAPSTTSEYTETRFSKGVQARLTLHPKTVTAMSEGRVSAPTPRRPRSKAKHPAAACESAQFHPTVWKIALQAAGGDPYRLVAFSLTDLRTMNKPRPRNSSIWDTHYLNAA